MKLTHFIVLMTALVGSTFASNVRKAAETEQRNKGGTPGGEPKVIEGVREEGKKPEENLEAENGVQPKYGWRRLQQGETGKCIGFDGMFAKLVPCWMGTFFVYDDNRLIITSYGPVGMCLGLHSNNKFVMAENCNYSSDQDWYGVRVSDTYYTYRFLNRKTGKYIDDVDSGVDYGFLDVVSDRPYDNDQYFVGIPIHFFA